MSSATALSGSIMAMIAITLVFDDDERGVGESSGLDTDASSLAPGATVRDEPKN